MEAPAAGSRGASSSLVREKETTKCDASAKMPRILQYVTHEEAILKRFVAWARSLLPLRTRGNSSLVQVRSMEILNARMNISHVHLQSNVHVLM